MSTSRGAQAFERGCRCAIKGRLFENNGEGRDYSSLYSKKLCQINRNSCLERAMRCVKFMCAVLVSPVCFWMHEGNLWEISPYLGCLYIYSILQDRALYVKDLLTHIIASSPTDSFTIYKAVTSG